MMKRKKKFLLTRSSRGATIAKFTVLVPPTEFLLTRPSRGATGYVVDDRGRNRISTHTPLAGRDLMASNGLRYVFYFYSHAPRGARQATLLPVLSLSNFYSHAPRGARLFVSFKWVGIMNFYSHAPRGARLYYNRNIFHFTSKFLLTRPSRGATASLFVKYHAIRFLLTRPSRGATSCFFHSFDVIHYFYSHAPRGARLKP